MSDCFDHDGDAWGSMEDYYNDGAGPRYRPRPRCNRCGTAGLRWVKDHPLHWRLYEGETPHVCPLPSDVFEDVS